MHIARQPSFSNTFSWIILLVIVSLELKGFTIDVQSYPYYSYSKQLGHGRIYFLPGSFCSLCSCHRIIVKFAGVITIDRRDVHAKRQCQRSKVKVTEVMTPFSGFRTVTPV